MTPERPQPPEPFTGSSRGSVRPRVVIFETDADASVEVVELPTGTGVGATIRHRGAAWHVVGERSHSRVLIASLLEH